MDQIEKWWSDLVPLYQSAFIIAGTILIYLFIKRVVLRKMEELSQKTENDLDDRFIHFTQQFLWVIMLFLGTLGILKSFNIAIAPLLAGAGIFGVALGFAAKESIADILAGIFLITDRPIRIGDRINFNSISGGHWGSWGDVIEIGLRRTLIRNSDGVYMNYPNNLLSNSIITNFSFDDKPIRVRFRFQVDYNADIDLVRELTLKVINENPRALPEKSQLIVRSIWDDQQGHLMAGVTLEARYSLADVRKRTEVRAEVLEALLKELKAHNISMPHFNPMTLPSQKEPTIN